MANELRIKQIMGLSRRPLRQRQTVKALGLKRIGHVVEKKNTPQIRGMIFKVKHLVAVDEV